MKGQCSEQGNNFWKIEQMQYWKLWLFENYMNYADWRDNLKNKILGWKPYSQRLAHWMGRGIAQMIEPPKVKRYTD